MATSAPISATVKMSWTSVRTIHRIALLQGELQSDLEGDALSATPGMQSPASFASVTVSVISSSKGSGSATAGQANDMCDVYLRSRFATDDSIFSSVRSMRPG